MTEMTTVGEKQTKNGNARLFGPIILQTLVIAASGAYILIRSPEITIKIVSVGAFVLAAVALLWALLTLRRPAEVEVQEAHPAVEPRAPRFHPDAAIFLDELTGLATRLWYERTIASEVSRSIRYRRPLSLIVLDVDRFSDIVRKGGDALGDYVMSTLADNLRAIVRRSDQLSRIADSELTVILPETDIAGARVVGEKMRRAIELYPFDEDLDVTVSVGIAALAAGENEGGLLVRSERAAEAARSKGGNTCAVANA